jgi:glutamate formiminotransferase/formiminotetrahydrofolate cyclodeaminase
MPSQIVECVPNFSEGRRPEVIEAIRESIAAVSGVHVLDQHIDADHNRSVITFAGPPESVLEAAFAAIDQASQWIDLDQHQGEHPRIGATDVVPFVPISGVEMQDCVELAKRLGKRVGEELGIPVYLYERAATRPDRENLSKLRVGEYEGLKEAIQSDPERVPDFGPAKLGKAGATVIGARAPLIAYNVYLTTDDVAIAKQIARTVRQSSGGLPFVKALGMLVAGRAQVSMNLTDYTQTSVDVVVEAIRAEAQKHGVDIHHSELVGLIPELALIKAARRYLQLEQFETDQVLETRLQAAVDKHGTFLDRLAAGTPTPGGGSAAAHAGAMAAALVAMVARLSMGKKKYAQFEERAAEIASQADGLRLTLEQAVIQDAQAFDQVMRALRMPKQTDDEKATRFEAIERATHQAAAVPLDVARQVTEVLALAVEVAEQGNVSAASDAGSACAMAQAGFTAAGLNVRINAASVKDEEVAKRWLHELDELHAQAEASTERVRKALVERAGLSHA